MIRPLVAVALAFAVVGAPLVSSADIQKTGPEVWPGKFQVSAYVLSGQIGFSGNEPSGYKFIADFAGRLKDFDKISLWLGGGINYAAGLFYGCAACGVSDLQFWAFVEISLEKLLKIPLVPYVRGGIGGDLLFYNVFAGAFVIRVGSGIDYFITKNIGLGAQMHFSLGPGFYGGGLGTLLYGTWDGGFGARFAF